jgi:hypothetical protein
MSKAKQTRISPDDALICRNAYADSDIGISTLSEAAMANLAGESNDGALKLDFDRRVMLQFRGSVVTVRWGIVGVPGTRGLTWVDLDCRRDACRYATGRNGRHALVGLLQQSVFGRLAGYEDVNDAELLRPRSGDALDRRRQGAAHGCAAFAEPDGPLRDTVACGT